ADRRYAAWRSRPPTGRVAEEGSSSGRVSSSGEAVDNAHPSRTRLLATHRSTNTASWHTSCRPERQRRTSHRIQAVRSFATLARSLLKDDNGGHVALLGRVSPLGHHRPL